MQYAYAFSPAYLYSYYVYFQLQNAFFHEEAAGMVDVIRAMLKIFFTAGC